LKKNCDIFISFIHEEGGIAQAIQALLQRDFPQRKTFMSDDIEPGKDWMREIRQAIQSAKVVILMLSPKSVGRRWINFEAGAAWFARDKRVVSLIYGGIRRLPKPFVDLQVIDLAKHPERLTSFIAAHLMSSAGARIRSKKPPVIETLPLPYVSWDIHYKAIAAALDGLKSKRRTARKSPQVTDGPTLEQRILKFFPTSGHFGASAQSISRALGVSLHSVEESLQRLESADSVHRLGDNWFRGAQPRWRRGSPGF
jgi:hypothetical protein